jgi:predicted amidophosphoribosyltransferase
MLQRAASAQRLMTMSGRARWVTQAARDLAQVWVPVWCPGCGARDTRWCDDCAAQWWDEPLRSESAAGRLHVAGRATLPVWAIAELDGSAHRMIAAWKDGGRRDLDRFFSSAMRRAAQSVASQLAGLGDLAVVPVPSRRRSVRARGADLPELLARAVVTGLKEAGVAARLAPVLVIGSGEQRGASVRERSRNAASLTVPESVQLGHLRGAQGVVLVDDVLTTGATMAAATMALEVRFITVYAGLCLASAPAAGTPKKVTVA